MKKLDPLEALGASGPQHLHRLDHTNAHQHKAIPSSLRCYHWFAELERHLPPHSALQDWSLTFDRPTSTRFPSCSTPSIV